MRNVRDHRLDHPSAEEQQVLARLRRRAEELFGSRAEGDRAVLHALGTCPRPCPEEKLAAALEDLAARRRPPH